MVDKHLTLSENVKLFSKVVIPLHTPISNEYPGGPSYEKQVAVFIVYSSEEGEVWNLTMIHCLTRKKGKENRT